MGSGTNAQAAATDSELYENAACGLLVTAADGRITRVNKTFCAWVGREAAGLLGLKVQDLLTVGGRMFHQTHWAPLLQMQGSVAEVKLEVLHTDGSKLPMVFNAVRRSHEGATHHELAVFVAEDRHRYEGELMGARQRAEELLAKEQQAQQALAAAQADRDQQQAKAEDRALFAEQMMAIVSHDLRNPLNVIRMSAYVMSNGELSSNQMRALARVNSATARAARLIVDLLDFSQARLGKGLQVTSQPIELHAMVEECVEELRLAFPHHELIHEQLGTGGCSGSSDRLVQMIGNLIANAVSYGAKNRPVVVTSAILDTSFVISVQNEGEPIAEETLPGLFDPMSRGAATRNTEHSIGLGLFIVRAIVQAHGGEVNVESSADSGTQFVATFPR